MLLGVLTGHTTARADQHCAVVVVDPILVFGPWGEPVQRRAGQQPGVGAGDEIDDPAHERIPLRVQRQGRLRPDHQLDVAALARLAGESEVGIDRRLLHFRRPLERLVNVALHHRHMGLHRPGSHGMHDLVADRRVAADKSKHDKGCEQQTPLLAHPPADAATLAVDDADQETVAENQAEGDQMMAAQICGLDQFGLAVETVAEIHPGEPGHEHAAQVIQSHPEERRPPDQRSHRAFPVPGAPGQNTEQKAENGPVTGHVGRKQQQAGQRQPQGQAAVTAQDDQNPVEQRQVVDQTAQKTHQGAAAGRGVKGGQEQGRQGDEQQGPPADPTGHGQGKKAGGEDAAGQRPAGLSPGQETLHSGRSGRI